MLNNLRLFKKQTTFTCRQGISKLYRRESGRIKKSGKYRKDWLNLPIFDRIESDSWKQKVTNCYLRLALQIIEPELELKGFSAFNHLKFLFTGFNTLNQIGFCWL